MTKHSIAKLGILTTTILAMPAISFAGTPSKEMKAVVEKCKESCITGDIGVNVVSQYVSRGLVFENQGAITQPYADLYFKLYSGEGFLNKVSVNLGIWNSFQSRRTDAGAVSGSTGSSTGTWYEFDFTAGVAFTFAKNFTLTPSYYTFLSPNDGFDTFQGLNVNLAYDDTDLLGKFALHPHFTVLFELDNKAGNGSDEGIYYEFGLAPSVPIGSVTLTFPLTVGFGSNDFYARNHSFGYFSGGINASYALKFIPECYGAWTFNIGHTYYYLGSALRGFNTPSRFADGSIDDPNIRDAGNNEFVSSAGLSVAF